MVLLDQPDQPHGVWEGVVAQGQHGTLGPDVDPLDTGCLAVGLDADDAQQLFGLVRQRPEPVDQLGGQGLARLGVFRIRQTAVQAQTDVQVGDIVFRDQHRRPDIDGRGPAAIDHSAALA